MGESVSGDPSQERTIHHDYDHQEFDRLATRGPSKAKMVQFAALS